MEQKSGMQTARFSAAAAFFTAVWVTCVNRVDTTVRPILRGGLYYGTAYTTGRPILRGGLYYGAAYTTAVLFCFNAAKSILPRIIRSIRLTNRSYVHVLWIAYAIHKTWLWATASPRSTSVADQRGVQVDRYGPFRWSVPKATILHGGFVRVPDSSTTTLVM